MIKELIKKHDEGTLKPKDIIHICGVDYIIGEVLKSGDKNGVPIKEDMIKMAKESKIRYKMTKKEVMSCAFELIALTHNDADKIKEIIDENREKMEMFKLMRN